MLTLLAVLATPAFAWTGPTTAPPNGNVSPPLNTSATSQVKTGNITTNGGLNTTAQVYANVPAGYGNWSVVGQGGNYGGYFKGSAYGVYGDSESNAGVMGVSANYIAVRGINTSGNHWAGYFEGGYGVHTQNTAGYYTQLANSSYGVLTNGDICISGGSCLSQLAGANAGHKFGGGYNMVGGNCYIANNFTGGCSCPGFAPNSQMITNQNDRGGTWFTSYTCYGS